LLAVPVPGTWSLQQIAIHMMDSDLIASDRMKRIASMDKPLLCGYDETNKVTLAEMVEKYIHHLDGHLVHVARKRENLNA